MRTSTVAAAAALLATAAVADLCSIGSQEIGGNWYCQPVKAITYSNVGCPGTYNQITNMPSSGSCSSTPKSFSGPLSPLDGEVSIHIRGPFALKQFAAYSPSTAAKRDVPANAATHPRRHNHRRQHRHNVEERDMVTAVINGKTVSWANQYSGGSATAAAAAPADTTCITASAGPAAASSPATSPSEEKSGKGIDSTGTWTRIGYYNSQSQTNDGLVFLNNMGGQGSGVFDYVYGNSLSYASSDGCTGASSPQILKDFTLPSNKEVIIMTDKKCNGDCGYVRDGTVAYHGFDGASKAFFLEFSMPDDGTSGFNMNMPAVWMLNAEIPRTAQYGKADCSCWTSGCGEFDIMEVLSSGSKFCKSTFHTNEPGGSSDYIPRPTSGTIKIAVVFDASKSTAHIQVLDDSTTFPTSMSYGQIKDYCSKSTGNQLSTFKIA